MLVAGRFDGVTEQIADQLALDAKGRGAACCAPTQFNTSIRFEYIYEHPDGLQIRTRLAGSNLSLFYLNQ